METKFTKGEWKVNESTPNEITIISPWSDKVRPESESTFGDYRGAHICSMQYIDGDAIPKDEIQIRTR
jgi:hypothetical protein